eukprot:7036578-Prymnesium_polylepis.1
MDKIARVFSGEWALYVKRGQIKPVPRGSVYSVSVARSEFAMFISTQQHDFVEKAAALSELYVTHDVLVLQRTAPR